MEGGRYNIRLLLTELGGRTSYDSLKKPTDGTVCETCREPAAARGLLMVDKERYIAFYESSSRAAPKAPSRLFASILSYSPQVIRAICGARFYPIFPMGGRPIQYPKRFSNSTPISGRW